MNLLALAGTRAAATGEQQKEDVDVKIRSDLAQKDGDVIVRARGEWGCGS